MRIHSNYQTTTFALGGLSLILGAGAFTSYFLRWGTLPTALLGGGALSSCSVAIMVLSCKKRESTPPELASRISAESSHRNTLKMIASNRESRISEQNLLSQILGDIPDRSTQEDPRSVEGFHSAILEEIEQSAGRSSRRSAEKSLTQVFTETKAIYKSGKVLVGSKEYRINDSTRETEIYEYKPTDKLTVTSNNHKTEFKVTNCDTFVAAQRACESEDVVCLNMANMHKRGGGVETGARAQEEDLCRRSNLMQSLESVEYPLPEFGGVHTPKVTVFRDSDYASIKPFHTAVISAAMYVGGTPRNTPDNVKQKIRALLFQAYASGHTHLILGAWGCGAFRNDPSKIAGYFEEVFSEFKGVFKTVEFAILARNERDKKNLLPFEKMCERLNQS